jgi:hypothetical protein
MRECPSAASGRNATPLAGDEDDDGLLLVPAPSIIGMPGSVDTKPGIAKYDILASMTVCTSRFVYSSSMRMVQVVEG